MKLVPKVCPHFSVTLCIQYTQLRNVNVGEYGRRKGEKGKIMDLSPADGLKKDSNRKKKGIYEY
jgi:hypothetical protein